ncbi:MAG TPA: hypothetical protein PKO19_02200 [Chitinophagales bacterium]|nr:hypothetical protein [Chitinophagales bacterium]
MTNRYALTSLGKPLMAALAVAGGLTVSAQSYIQSTCDYAPLTTEGTVICLGDDAVSSAIPLGFSFNFYDVPYTDCYVSSNGYLSFAAGLGSACCTGQILPNATYPASIFFGQEDLDPNSCIDGDISYYTTGAPGSQIFVLSFVDVPHYPGPEGTFPVTVQVQLYEGTNEVRIVTTQWNSDGGAATMGLNENGSNADPVSGRNSEVWSAFDECISFVPNTEPTGGCMDAAAINYDPGADFDDGTCFYGYIASTCDYSPMATEGTIVCLGDDQVSTAIDMGFDFPFYGTPHNQAYISSNGFVTFQPGMGSGCCTGQILPNATYQNTIFIGQEDLDPNTCVDGEINYYTTGAPGSQVFVVNFIGVPHYPGPAGTFNITVQLQCYEATGEIRIVTTEWNSDGGAATMGLNYNGTYADWVPGRNSSVWDAFDECYSWMPLTEPLPVCDAPGGLFADGITTDDAVLHWDAVDGAMNYNVILQNTATGLLKKKVFTTNMAVIENKLSPLTNYAFRVKTGCGVDPENMSDPSPWYYFTTLGRTGEEQATVTLFPNPNNGVFTLNVAGYADNSFNLNIYNTMGAIVYTKTVDITSDNQAVVVSLENVPGGMYQINLSNDQYQINYPVIVTK